MLRFTLEIVARFVQTVALISPFSLTALPPNLGRVRAGYPPMRSNAVPGARRAVFCPIRKRDDEGISGFPTFGGTLFNQQGRRASKPTPSLHVHVHGDMYVR